MICGGQIIYQGIIVGIYQKRSFWSYLGNMMTISFAGSLLLLIPIVFNHWFHIQPLFFILYFMTVAGLMFLEHIRRTKLLNLGWMMTITWAVYRVLLLMVILFL